MADDKRGREKQAADAERRQRERALDEALERADETEPPSEAVETDDTVESAADREETSEGDVSGSRECHRRGCSEPAEFVVRERYLEETGHGAVVAEAFLCREHVAEEGPTNLDHSYPEYVFCVEPIADEEAGASA